MLKKIICMSIALIMLLTVLISCKNNSETPSDETSSNNGSVSTNDDVVETDKYGQPVYSDPTAGLNFGGKTVNILVRSGEQYIREWCSDSPQSNLDQEIFKRNLAVEEDLGVKLNFIPQNEGDLNKEIMNKVINTASSGLGGIDVVSLFAAFASNQSAMPYYLNWYDQEKLPYLNLDRKYWNQNYIRDGAAFGKTYLMVGDVNLSVYDRCMVVFFNKAKAESYLKDSTGNAINLYELVQKGEWYYETFYNMTKDIYEDVGTIQGDRDDQDFYGVTGIKGSEASDAFLYSLGGSLTKTNDDGSHELVTETDLVRLESVFTAMQNFWNAPGAIMPADSMTNYDIFTGGHALFTVDVVWHYSAGLQKLQAMDGGYGIIPMPKLDEDQDEYITGVQDAYNTMAILQSGGGQDFEMISAVLEKMCYESYSNVRPYYVETILMARQMDMDSAMCFNYVLDGIRWDFSDVYATAIGTVRNALWRNPFQANVGFASNWQMFKTKYETNLANFDVWMASQQ